MNPAVVIEIPDALADRYKGCGIALAAIRNGTIVGLVYVRDILPDPDDSPTAWERDPHVANDIDSIWTASLIVGDGPDDMYDICVVGEPGRIGPTPYDVTGSRDGEAVTFAAATASSWDEACRLAEIEARRASIRPVE